MAVRWINSGDAMPTANRAASAIFDLMDAIRKPMDGVDVVNATELSEALVIVATRPTGAASTTFAASVTDNAPAVVVTPRLANNSRSLSSAREMRIRAASSL